MFRLLNNKRLFSSLRIPSLSTLTPEEHALKEAVQKFSIQQLQPKVQEMDEQELLNPSILKGLFEQGFMGIETDLELGGSGSSFMSAILTVEGMNTNAHEYRISESRSSCLCCMRCSKYSREYALYKVRHQRAKAKIPSDASYAIRRMLLSF
jgi:hypothetical protein